MTKIKSKRGGPRENAGRRVIPPCLKKVAFNTRIPKWIKDWMVSDEREESAPRMIEYAICRVYKLKPPKDAE